MTRMIESLAERATKMTEARPNTGMVLMKDYNEAFANLIIQECVNVCVNRSLFYIKSNKTEAAGAVGSIANSIKRHFEDN